MTNLVSIADWLGHHGEPLHPESMRYVTSPAKSCRGCLFDGQRAAICERAIAAAVRVGFEHCEKDGVIYVSDTDPRQIPLAQFE